MEAKLEQQSFEKDTFLIQNCKSTKASSRHTHFYVDIDLFQTSSHGPRLVVPQEFPKLLFKGFSDQYFAGILVSRH